MRKLFNVIAAISVLLAGTPFASSQQQGPLFETRKVSDSVYVFRYQNHQSMFVVTPQGVIVTDPISFARPQAAKAYIDEIRKITSTPVRYVVYSHHHYDNVAGRAAVQRARRDLCRPS